MAWEHRVGGRQAVEEQVERRRTRLPQRARQPHAVRAQAVSRDLVDEHRVEVVHHRVPVAGERVRGRFGQCRGDLGEGRLHALVERRAPERVPPAAIVVEVGVDEAFGDRTMRQLDEREDGSCASAGGRLGRRGSRRGGSVG